MTDPRTLDRRRHSGFTAVEVTMVAAVIAILTLIAVPMFHKQIERARKNATMDGMKGLAHAEDLAYAETGFYYRPNDLDNTTIYTANSTSAALEIPVAIWNRPLLLEIGGEYRWKERWFLANSERRWNGPYMRYPKYVYLDELVNTFDPLLFRYADGLDANRNPNITNGEGPILILEGNPLDLIDPNGTPAPTDKYPVDPWGNPYIFFGPGQLIPDDSRFTDYPKSVIFSMGPNGLPGGDDGANIVQASFWREGAGGGNASLGTFDDLFYEF